MRLPSAHLPTLLCVLLLCFSVVPYSARAAETLWRHSVHTKPVASVAVSPDGAYIASCDSAGTMVLSETETGALVTALTNDSLQCRCVCFTASGKLFALWSSRSNAESSFAACVVKEYTLPGMQESRQWRTERGGGEGNRYNFVKAQIAASGDYIFWLFDYQLTNSTVDLTGQVVVRLDIPHGQAYEQMFGYQSYFLTSMSPTPDGRSLLVAMPNFGKVHVVDISTMYIASDVFFEMSTDIIRVAPGGTFAVSRDTATTLNRFLHKKIDVEGAPTFEFSPDGKVLIAPSSDNSTAPALYSVVEARWLYQYESSNGVRQNALAVCPDNRTFITGADDGSLTRWLLPESVRTLPLAVDFTVRDSNVYAGRLVQFDPLLPAIADTFSLRWSFGDGGKSTSFAPAHRYVRTGRYTVTMEVITPEGEVLSSATRTSYINVQHLDSGVRWVQGGDNSSSVRLLAVSRDSSRVAALFADYSLAVLNATTGDIVYRSSIDQQRSALALALSLDGKTVYTIETSRKFAGDAGYPNDGDSCEWLLYERHIESGRTDSTLIRKMIFYTDMYWYQAAPMACIGVSPDGNTIAINIGWYSKQGNYDSYQTGEMYVLDKPTGKVKKVQSVFGQIASFDFSRDGKTLLFPLYRHNNGGHSTDPYSYTTNFNAVYSIPRDSIEQQLWGSEKSACARFSPDDVYVATADTLYDYASRTALHQLSAVRSNVFEWAGTGVHLVALKASKFEPSSQVYLHNVLWDSVEASYDLHNAAGTALAMNKGATSFFVGCNDGSIICWQIADTVQRPPLTARFSVADTIVSLLDTVRFDNKTFPLSPGMTWEWDFGDGATGNTAYPGHVYKTPGSYTVQLHVRNEKGEESTVVKEQYIVVPPLSNDIIWFNKQGNTPVYSVAFSPDNSLVAAAAHGSHIVLKRTATGEVIPLPPIPTISVDAVSFSPDGRFLYAFAYGYSSYFPSMYSSNEYDFFVHWNVYKYDIEQQTVSTPYQIDFNDLLGGPVHGKDSVLDISTRLVAASGDSMLYVSCVIKTVTDNYGPIRWSLVVPYNMRRDTIQMWDRHDDQNPDSPLNYAPEFFAISRDGTYLVSTNEEKAYKVVLRNALTRYAVGRFQDSSLCARFTDDNQMVVTNRGVWQIKSGELIQSLSLADTLLFDVFPGNQVLAVARPGSDNAMSIVSLEADATRYEYGRAPSHIVAMTISSDRRYIATGGENGYVAVWQVPESATTTVQTPSGGTVHLAPNPTTDALVVSIVRPETGWVRVTLLDSFGQVVAEQSSVDGNSNFHFSVANVASGVYLCRVETPSGVVVRTVVVCH